MGWGDLTRETMFFRWSSVLGLIWCSVVGGGMNIEGGVGGIG